MDFRDLQLLVTTAEAKGFSGAARLLGLDTSTISRRIGCLEDQLGLALFERCHAGVRLTRGGSAVVQQAVRALEALASVERVGNQRGTGEVGELRLGVCVPPIGGPFHAVLSGWRRRFPRVNLTLHEMEDCSMLAAVEKRQLDVGLIARSSRTSGLVDMPLYRERLVAALPANHSLADKEAVKWTDLLGETILIREWAESKVAREYFIALLGKGAQFQPHPASLQGLVALVAADFGVALVTSGIAVAAPVGVTFRSIDEPDAWLPMDLVWRAGLEDAVVGRFIAHARDEALSGRLLQ